MSTYAQLNDDQRTAVQVSLPHLRRALAEVSQALNKIQFMRLGTATQYVDGVITSLDDAELIPMEDAGNEFQGSATVVSAAQLKAVLGIADALSAINDANFKNLAVSIVGPFRAIKGS